LNSEAQIHQNNIAQKSTKVATESPLNPLSANVEYTKGLMLVEIMKKGSNYFEAYKTLVSVKTYSLLNCKNKRLEDVLVLQIPCTKNRTQIK